VNPTRRWRRPRTEEWAPPRRFVDHQLPGPFRRWRHLHPFTPDGGGTRLADAVDYDVSCRPLARTPLLGWIEADLRRIFEFRQTRIAELFDDAGGEGEGLGYEDPSRRTAGAGPRTSHTTRSQESSTTA